MKIDDLLIDGDGGPKTDVCLARMDGAVVRRRRFPGMTLSGIGINAAFEQLQHTSGARSNVLAL